MSVLDLRRLHHRDESEEHLDDGSTVMWTHRWPVREHTRTLYRGTSREKTVTVKGYEKGPAHLPLIVKDRVYRLSR